MTVSGFAKIFVGGGLMAWAGLASAADLPAPPPAATSAPLFTTWEFSATAYVWGSGLKGTLATVSPLPPLNVDLTFSDILKNLGGALMGTFEAKYGRFVLFNDLMFTVLRPEGTRARGPVTLTIDVDSSALVGLAAAGYRVVEGEQLTIDALAGVRGFYMDNEIKVRVAGGGFDRNAAFAKSKAWLDAVGGMRLRYQLDDKWLVNLIAVAGAGASRYQWDVYGGVGYSFNRNWGAFAGYRAFKVDYRDGDFIYDVLQHGPLLGLQYRW